VANDGAMIWGGRFEVGPDARMLALTESLSFDVRLLEHDVASTKAHARALVAARLLEQEFLDDVDAACDAIVAEWRAGSLRAGASIEDVHTLVERELTVRLGEVGSRIHAGRSRNDLVANDLRLWCKERAAVLRDATLDLADVLVDRAAAHLDTVMPGYTHLQRAQPVSLGFHLAAHAFALLRDAERFMAAGRAADVSVLGAGALATNTLGLDPQIAALELGFGAVFENAMDAVSQRDFVCDLVYACAVCSTHMSRFAEEIVLWSSSEFAFARLPDEWSTGSSMMPQKRNPDLPELTRGRAAVTIGDLGSLLGVLKGLPLAYNRDLQEDKQIVFASVDRTEACLAAMRVVGAEVDFDPARLEVAARGGASWATDLAELLVARGVPFREAHEATGRLVASLEQRDIDLAGADEDLLKEHHPAFVAGDTARSEPRACLDARSGPGGPAPDRVAEQVTLLRQRATGLRRDSSA
jgi:argininosuccinate lyase